MATAAAAADLGQVGDPIKPLATRGKSSESGGMFGSVARPGCVAPPAATEDRAYTWAPGGSGRVGGGELVICQFGAGYCAMSAARRPRAHLSVYEYVFAAQPRIDLHPETRGAVRDLRSRLHFRTCWHRTFT